MWCAIYEKLSEGKPGLLGAVISRAEAQVVRLALLYALLDCSKLIRAEHLEACPSPKFCPPLISTGYGVAVHKLNAIAPSHERRR